MLTMLEWQGDQIRLIVSLTPTFAPCELWVRNHTVVKLIGSLSKGNTWRHVFLDSPSVGLHRLIVSVDAIKHYSKDYDGVVIFITRMVLGAAINGNATFRNWFRKSLFRPIRGDSNWKVLFD